MVFAIGMLIVIYLLWVLLVKGALWKIILGAFGWFGLYVFLSTQWHLDKESPFKDNFMSWAAIIPTVLVLLVMASTKDE
jgi:hypothetical protein